MASSLPKTTLTRKSFPLNMPFPSPHQIQDFARKFIFWFFMNIYMSSKEPMFFHPDHLFLTGLVITQQRDITEDEIWYIWCLTVLYATKLVFPVLPLLNKLNHPELSTSLTWTLFEWFSPLPWWHKKTTTNCWRTSSSRASRRRRKTVHYCFYYPRSILPASSNQRFLDTELELWMDHYSSHCLSWIRLSNQDFFKEFPHGTQPYSSRPTRYPPHIPWAKTWNVYDPHTILTFSATQSRNHHKRRKARLH